MCGGFCGRRLDVGGASWAARIVAAALILALAPTTPTAGWLLCAATYVRNVLFWLAALRELWRCMVGC